MTEKEKKKNLKTIELYIEGGRNPAGGAGKKLLQNGPLCLIMRMEN